MTEEQYQQQLEWALQVIQHEVVMAYPNVLETPDPDGLKLMEGQALQLEECARRLREEKRKHLEENRAAGEGIFGTLHDDDNDELVSTNTRALEGQSKITAKGRRLRE